MTMIWLWQKRCTCGAMDYKITNDGSKTLFSSKYNQAFHSIDDGALSEALYKHIIPAFTLCSQTKEINILDICFGLGYNTFGTIYYILKNNLNIKVNIFSPELDAKLVGSLLNFDYPKEFDCIKHIILEVAKNNYYSDENFTIEMFIGDAREYVKKLKNIDIVFQDAFSSDTNKELWTKEYFGEIKKCCNSNAILTTYSIATPVRFSMYENGFMIYEYQSTIKKRGTIGSLSNIKNNELGLKWIDMEKKRLNSPNSKSFSDFD